MKNNRRLTFVAAVFTIAASPFLLAQGPLTPPGAPAPTMKTLDQVEPRIPISTLSYHITSPGSYYLTQNVSGSNGITIDADDVTLDLNGFQIRIDNPGNGQYAIQVLNGRSRVTIRNGSVRALLSGGAVVAHTFACANMTVEDLRIEVSTGNGPGIATGDRGVVKNCQVRANASNRGISSGKSSRVTSCTVLGPGSGGVLPGIGVGVDSLVSGCAASLSPTAGIQTDAGCVVTDCVANSNLTNGVTVGSNSTVRNCATNSNGGDGVAAGSGSTVMNSSAASNAADGFDVATGGTILDCTAFSNAGDGIRASDGSTITHCTVRDNAGSYGIFAGVGSTLTGCTASSNDVEYGIQAGDRSTLAHCTAGLNTSAAADSWGISAGAQCTISQCTASGNLNTNGTPTGSTGGGIVAANGSTVQNCTVAANKGDGIRVFNDALVVENTCDSNGLPVGTGDGAGVHASSGDNRIEGNNVSDNTRGIDVDSGGNLIIKNSASGNTSNYEIAANNFYGAIVDRTGQLTPAVSGNSAAPTTGTTDPWSNFSY